jgi:hypothetical protein
MITKEERDALQYCLDNTFKVHGIANSHKVWYTDNDTMLSVAQILDGECCFRDTGEAVLFFEKPHKWESNMKELVDEYDEENS